MAAATNFVLRPYPCGTTAGRVALRPAPALRLHVGAGLTFGRPSLRPQRWFSNRLYAWVTAPGGSNSTYLSSSQPKRRPTFSQADKKLRGRRLRSYALRHPHSCGSSLDSGHSSVGTGRSCRWGNLFRPGARSLRSHRLVEAWNCSRWSATSSSRGSVSPHKWRTPGSSSPHAGSLARGAGSAGSTPTAELSFSNSKRSSSDSCKGTQEAMQEQRLGSGRKIAVEFVGEHEGPEEDASQKEDKTVNLASLHAEIKEVRALVSTQVEKDESIEKNAEVVLRQLLAELEETVGVSERLQAAAKTSEQQTSIVKHQLEVSLQQSKESAAEAKQQLVTVKEQLRKAQEQNRWAVEAAAEARQQLHAVESSSKEEVESMRVKMQKADEQQRLATIALSERESKFAAMEETAERQVEALRVQIRDGLEQRRLWKGAFVEAKDELAALQAKALQEAAYLQTQLRKAQEQQEILTQSSNDSVDAGELAAVDSEMAQRNNLLLKQLLSQLEEAVGVSEKLQLQLGEAQQISASAQVRAEAAEAALTERSALLESMSAELKAARSRAVPVRAREEAVLAERNAGEVALKAEREGRTKAEEALSKLQAEFTAITAENLVAKDKLEGEQDAQKKVEPELEEAVSQGNRFPVQWSKQDETPRESVDDALRSVTRDIDEVVREAVMAERNAGTLILSAERAARKSAEQALSAAKPGRDEESTEAVMAERMAGALRLRAEQHVRKTTEAELAAGDSRLKEAVDNAVMSSERRSASKLIEAESKAQELAQEAVATSQAEAVPNMQKEMEAERISLAAELAKERELRTGAEEELGRIIVKLDEASRALAYESEERKSEIEMLRRDLQAEKAHTAELMAALDQQRLIDNESDLRHVMLLSEIANLGKELREIGSLADTLTSSDAESGEPSVNTMLELQADMKRMDAQLLDMELRNESGRMENGEMRDDEARQLSPRRKEEGAAVPGAAAMFGLDVPPPTDDSATNKSTPPKDVLKKPVLAGSVGWLGWAFGGGGGGGSSGGGGFGGGGGGFSDGDRPSSGLEYWLLMGAAVAGTVFLLKQALIPWMLTRLTPRRHLRLCEGLAARHRDRRARRMLPLDMAGNPCAALVLPLGTHVPYVSLGEEEDMFLDTFHTPVEMSDSDEVDDIITLTNVGLTGLTAPPASVRDELGEWDSRLFKSPALPAFPPKRSPTDDIPHLMSKLAEVREHLAASSCREAVAIEILETKEAEMAVQLDSAASMQRWLEAELADVRRKLTESSEREAVTVEDAKEKQAHTSAAFDNLQSDLDSATQLGISLHTELEDLRQKLAVSSEREALAVEIANEKQAELSAVVEKMLVRLDSGDRLCLSKDAELAGARQKLAESSDREAQSVEDANEKRVEVSAVVENMLARLDSADQLRISLKKELADVRQTLAEAVQRETMAVEALAAAEEENSATVKRMEVEIDNQVQSRCLLEAELAMQGVKVSQLSQQEARAVEASEAVEASKKVIQAELDRNAQLCRSLQAEITTLRSQVGNKDELIWGALLRTMTALEDLLPFEVPEKKPAKLEDLFLAVQAFAEAVLAAKDRVETALSVRSEVDASEAQLLRLHLAKAEERAENAESEARNGKSLAEELSSEVALLQESLAERMTVLGNSRQKEQMLESDMLKSVYELVEVRAALAMTQKQVEEERAKAESVEAARLQSSAQFDERLEHSCRAVLNTAGELERERAKVTQLESTLASKSDQLSKMEEKLASVAAAEAKLKDALKTRQEDLVVAEAALLALHASVAAKDGELTGLKEKLEEAEAQKEARMDETGTLRRQLEEAVEVLKEQVEQEERARVSAEATANAAEEARSAEEAIRGAAEASLRSALVKLDKAERGVASKSCEVDEIQAQFGEIVFELEKAAGRLSRTEAEVQKVVEERAGMAVELERVRDDCAAAKTERGEMETAMAALTDNAMALQAEVERVMGEMDGMRGAHEVSCQRLESAQQVNTMVKAALQGLASEVADMETTVSTLQDQRDLAQLQVSTLSMEVASLSRAKHDFLARQTIAADLEAKLRAVKVAEWGSASGSGCNASGALFARVPSMMAELLHLQNCSPQDSCTAYVSKLKLEVEAQISALVDKQAGAARLVTDANTYVSAAAACLDASMVEGDEDMSPADDTTKSSEALVSLAGVKRLATNVIAASSDALAMMTVPSAGGRRYRDEVSAAVGEAVANSSAQLSQLRAAASAVYSSLLALEVSAPMEEAWAGNDHVSQPCEAVVRQEVVQGMLSDFGEAQKALLAAVTKMEAIHPLCSQLSDLEIRLSWATAMTESGTGALVDKFVAELMKAGADTDEVMLNNAEIQASVDGLLDVVDEMRRMNAELRLENERLLRTNEIATSSSEESSEPEAITRLDQSRTGSIPGAKTWVNYSYRTSTNSRSPNKISEPNSFHVDLDSDPDWSPEVPRRRTMSDTHQLVVRSKEPDVGAEEQQPLSATRMKVLSPGSRGRECPLNISNESAPAFSLVHGASLRRKKRLRRSLGVSTAALSPPRRRDTADERMGGKSADSLDTLLREAQAALKWQMMGLRAAVGVQRQLHNSGSLMSGAIPAFSADTSPRVDLTDSMAAAMMLPGGLRHTPESSSDSDAYYGLGEAVSPFIYADVDSLPFERESDSANAKKAGEKVVKEGTPPLQVSDSPEVRVPSKPPTPHFSAGDTTVELSGETSDGSRVAGHGEAGAPGDLSLTTLNLVDELLASPPHSSRHRPLPPLVPVTDNTTPPAVSTSPLSSVNSSKASKSSTRRSLKKLFSKGGKGDTKAAGRLSRDGSLASSGEDLSAAAYSVETVNKSGRKKFRLFPLRKSKQ